MGNVLIGAGPLRGQPGFFRDRLIGGGFQTIDPSGPDVLSEADLREWLPQCEAIVAGSELISGPLIETCPGLRVIARVGVGYDTVDVPTATTRGVVVTITPGTNQESVAEHAFALLLAVCRQVASNDHQIRAGGWVRPIVQPLRGRTIGLVGLGRIGRAMVPRAQAFGMQVMACDPFLDHEYAHSHDVRVGSLDEVLDEADIVSLHLPAAPGTRGLIGHAQLSRMRRGSVLINTARGSLVDEAALLDALTQGPLSGAGLDVLDEEPPPPDHPLLKLPNVVFSPHIGGLDSLSLAAMAESAAQSILDLRAGKWPSGRVVNTELEAGWHW